MAKKTVALPERSAALVGFSLLLFVAMTQVMHLIMQAILKRPPDAASTDHPEWLVGLIGLVLIVVRFSLPLIFLMRSGKALGYQLHKGRSRVPAWVILPAFLGVVVASNSIISLMRTVVSKLGGVPAAEYTPLPQSGWGLFFYFMTICVAAPVLEELFFRGTIQQMLRFWGARFALILTAVIFTLLHNNLWNMLTVMVLSLLLGYAYEVGRSVRTCILLHFSNNLVAFLFQLAHDRMETNAGFALILWMMLLLVALFVASVWAVRYFKLGRRMILRRDPRVLGTMKARLRRIAEVPLFSLGMLALVAQFILGML